MKTNKDDAKKMIVSELLSYLAEHPQAQDTLEGITNWWLLEQEINRRASEVKATLEALIKDEFLIEIHGEDGRVHYKINREKQEEIELYLNRLTAKHE